MVDRYHQRAEGVWRLPPRKFADCCAIGRARSDAVSLLIQYAAMHPVQTSVSVVSGISPRAIGYFVIPLGSTSPQNYELQCYLNKLEVKCHPALLAPSSFRLAQHHHTEPDFHRQRRLNCNRDVLPLIDTLFQLDWVRYSL